MRSSRNTLYISRPPTLPALQSEPWQLAPAPSVIPPLTWPLPQELRPSCPPPKEQEEGEEDDNDEEGEEEDDGEEEGEDDGGEEEDYPEEDADGQPIDDEDYPVTGPANYGVEVIEYDEVGREDRTDHGQPIDYPVTATYCVQVIEYDEEERETFDVQDYPDASDYGQDYGDYGYGDYEYGDYCRARYEYRQRMSPSAHP